MRTTPCCTHIAEQGAQGAWERLGAGCVWWSVERAASGGWSCSARSVFGVRSAGHRKRCSVGAVGCPITRVIIGFPVFSGVARGMVWHRYKTRENTGKRCFRGTRRNTHPFGWVFRVLARTVSATFDHHATVQQLWWVSYQIRVCVPSASITTARSYGPPATPPAVVCRWDIRHGCPVRFVRLRVYRTKCAVTTVSPARTSVIAHGMERNGI